MLARTVTTLPVGDGLVYEPKWDGFRARVTTSPTRIISKSGRVATRQWPELVAAFDQLPGGLLLDGEIVRWTEGGLDFGALLRRNTAEKMRVLRLAREEPAHFVAFDLLQRDGRDISHRSLAYRRAQLEAVMADTDPHLDLSWQTDDPDTAREWFDGLSAAGIEGLVIKDTRRAYQPGRRGWDKYKSRVTTEAIVGGVVGTPHMVLSLILGRREPDTGELRVVGRTVDLTDAQREGIRDLTRKAGPDHPWGPTLLPAWGSKDRIHYTRVRPELVVEVQPDTATIRDRWRHLVRYVRPRPDLQPGDVPPGLDIEKT
jgi:ATP-dependent DNA ligase